MQCRQSGWREYRRPLQLHVSITMLFMWSMSIPYEAIIDVAETKGCDLIVMASHGRRGISAMVLGSETLKVLTHSTIPVLVCRTARAEVLRPFAAS